MARLSAFCLSCVLAWSAAAEAGTLTVASTQPAAQSLGAPLDGVIEVRFDRPVDRSTVVARRSFWAFGRWTGPVDGTFSYADGDRVVRLTPNRPLLAGDRVMVILADSLRGADGSSFREAGFSYQFWTVARRASLDFQEIDRFSTRTSPGVSSRAYGGIATDLDLDGHPDLTIVNEDTADLRVFLNQADGSGLFGAMLQPTSAVGAQASPSEPSDFDADGRPDIAVANIQDDTVSILLGNGDGTFQAQQLIAVNAAPRGLAVLDADGDGDADVAVTSASASTISLLLNDGSGAFGPPSSFGTGNASEWALVAADLDEDGILDLVAGGQTTQRVYVYAGDGAAGFSLVADEAVGGRVWMLNSGDVNGDGHEDIASVNSSSGNGAILLGDGTGGLASAVNYTTDPFSLASDLADLDGDGDLDWVTSSFSGDWWIFTNDGAGSFAFFTEIVAPRAASCSLPVDFDGDGDLDLALIDELEDEVILMINGGEVFDDGFESGDVLSWSGAVP